MLEELLQAPDSISASHLFSLPMARKQSKEDSKKNKRRLLLRVASNSSVKLLAYPITRANSVASGKSRDGPIYIAQKIPLTATEVKMDQVSLGYSSSTINCT